MTAQRNQGITFAAPAAIEIRRRPCCPVDVATHTVAVFRAGGGADLEVAADERPAVKRELIEMWLAERNAFVETVVEDMRTRN